MFIVGIDIGKRNHEATIIDQDGVMIRKSFSFSNTCSGYNLLLEQVKRITKVRDDIVFGMESTGHYWLPIYYRLAKEGYRAEVINPMKSDSLRGMYLRQHKSDAVDSLIIADVIRFGRFTKTNLAPEKTLLLKELTRNRFYIVDVISDMKRKVTAIMDRVFPEYESLFSNMFIKSSMELLCRYSTPEKVNRSQTKTITTLLLKHSNSYHGEGKAVQLKELAKNSFGIPDTYNVYFDLIRSYIEQIRFMTGKLEELDVKIKEFMLEINSTIISITGISFILGAVILAETGDISKFSSPDKLAAFAGIDPTVSQSGVFSGKNNRMSKRGSPYLRRALWMASTIAVRSDPMFKAYMDKKQAEGKKYMVAMGHVTKKMSNVIFAILRDNKIYEPMPNVA